MLGDERIILEETLPDDDTSVDPIFSSRSLFTCLTNVRAILIVPVICDSEQINTSLVDASKFATSVLYNFCWKRPTELKFTALLDKASLYHFCERFY